jgi:hypothetical protein
MMNITTSTSVSGMLHMQQPLLLIVLMVSQATRKAFLAAARLLPLLAPSPARPSSQAVSAQRCFSWTKLTHSLGGNGTGIGTLIGTGTVWPKALGGLVSYVTSGTASGAGRFDGCGTLVSCSFTQTFLPLITHCKTGTGYFSATLGSPVLISPVPTSTSSSLSSTSLPSTNSTSSGPTKTVSVYLSYCPAGTDAASLNRVASSSDNSTSPYHITSDILNTFNQTSPANHTTPQNSTFDPLCQSCPNTAGVCCPPTVSCSPDDGKCPDYAMENSGYTLNGYLKVLVVNSTGVHVEGKKKVRALGKGDIRSVEKEEERVRRELEKRKKGAHSKKHKHF